MKFKICPPLSVTMKKKMEIISLPGRDPVQPSHEIGALRAFTSRDKNLGIINEHVTVDPH